MAGVTKTDRFSRRDLLRLGLFAAASPVLLLCRDSSSKRLKCKYRELLSVPAEHTGRDKFGGCRDFRFEGTGFFRLEKADRWWFVTPEGNAFVSFGVNHVNPGLLQRKENREHWLEEFSVSSKSRTADPVPHFRVKVRVDRQLENTSGTGEPTAQWIAGAIWEVQSLHGGGLLMVLRKDV